MNWALAIAALAVSFISGAAITSSFSGSSEATLEPAPTVTKTEVVTVTPTPEIVTETEYVTETVTPMACLLLEDAGYALANAAYRAGYIEGDYGARPIPDDPIGRVAWAVGDRSDGGRMNRRLREFKYQARQCTQ